VAEDRGHFVKVSRRHFTYPIDLHDENKSISQTCSEHIVWIYLLGDLLIFLPPNLWPLHCLIFNSWRVLIDADRLSRQQKSTTPRTTDTGCTSPSLLTRRFSGPVMFRRTSDSYMATLIDIGVSLPLDENGLLNNQALSALKSAAQGNKADTLYIHELHNRRIRPP
jgi:hypothetical protein